LSLSAHLLVVQVVLPLTAAPLCVLLRSSRGAWATTVVTCGAVFASALSVLWTVQQVGELSYALGGWAAPYGIEYRVDALNAFVAVIVAGVAVVVAAWARPSVNAEVPRRLHYLFYGCYLLCLCGLQGITVTGDAFNVFVFLEVSSLAMYVLVGLGRDRRAVLAAFHYLILGSIGGTFILIGVGLLYQQTGTLNMADLSARIPDLVGRRELLVSFAFLTVGTCLKLALFPLHSWLPNAYTYAPRAVSAFVSATATKVMVYVFLRFTFSIFGTAFSFELLHLDKPLMFLALAGIYAGSAVAIFQDDVKRLLAYSSIAQIGYIVLGVSGGGVYGLIAAVLHLFNHALIKGGLFLVMGNVALKVGSTRLADLNGLGRQMPFTAAAFLVGGLGLIGVPATVGFVTKWYLIVGLLGSGHYAVAALALGSSLLAVTYVWRVVEVMYMREPSGPMLDVREAPLGSLLPAGLLIGGTLVFGLAPSGFSGLDTVAIATDAAQILLGEAP